MLLKPFRCHVTPDSQNLFPSHLFRLQIIFSCFSLKAMNRHPSISSQNPTPKRRIYKHLQSDLGGPHYPSIMKLMSRTTSRPLRIPPRANALPVEFAQTLHATQLLSSLEFFQTDLAFWSLTILLCYAILLSGVENGHASGSIWRKRERIAESFAARWRSRYVGGVRAGRGRES